MTHTRTRRALIAQGYVVASVVTLCVLIINALYGNQVVIEMLRWVLLVFGTAIACGLIYIPYWFGFVRPKRKKPIVEANQKMTLAEMGMTLEEAAQDYIDLAPLVTIKKLHQREHRVWTNEFRRLLDQDDKQLPVVDAEDVQSIYDYHGKKIRQTKPKCKGNHKTTEVCYLCDGKGY